MGGIGPRRVLRLCLLGGATTLLVAASLLYLGGAVQWQREPPYQLAASWGQKGDGRGEFNEPTGIAAGGGHIYVADARNARIQVFDDAGRWQQHIGVGQLGRPMNLSLRGERLYVADFFADQVVVFSRDGELLARRAPRDGLRNPGGVDRFADGSLLVADTFNQRVVRFDADGTVLRTWGQGDGTAQFNYPTDVAVRRDQGFVVADGYNDRIQQFGSDGRLLRRWGGPFAANVFGPFPGWFATVTSLALDDGDRVFAADHFNDRVQKFDQYGQFLTGFGSPLPGSDTHTAIAVDVDENGDVWVANYARHRVERWTMR